MGAFLYPVGAHGMKWGGAYVKERAPARRRQGRMRGNGGACGEGRGAFGRGACVMAERGRPRVGIKGGVPPI